MNIITIIRQWVMANIGINTQKVFWTHNNVSLPTDWYCLADIISLQYVRKNELMTEITAKVRFVLTVFTDNDEERFLAVQDKLLNGFDLIYSRPLIYSDSTKQVHGTAKEVIVDHLLDGTENTREVIMIVSITETKQ